MALAGVWRSNFPDSPPPELPCAHSELWDLSKCAGNQPEGKQQVRHWCKRATARRFEGHWFSCVQWPIVLEVCTYIYYCRWWTIPWSLQFQIRLVLQWRETRLCLCVSRERLHKTPQGRETAFFCWFNSNLELLQTSVLFSTWSSATFWKPDTPSQDVLCVCIPPVQHWRKWKL